MKQNSKTNKSIFQIFKFGKSRKKENLYTPSDARTWITHLLSEFFGTFLISIGLAGLTIVMPNNKMPVEYMKHEIIVGIYAFGLVLFLLIIFLRWSCDINPTVSVFRIINGTNSVQYGLAKITIQFLGGFVAGVMVWALTQNSILSGIDATKNNLGVFELGKYSNSHVPLSKPFAFFWELLVETFMIIVLLWSVFSKAINERYRVLIISLAISSVLMAGFVSSGNSLTMNPARAMASQIPAILDGQINHGGLLITTIALLLTGITGPFLYALIQGYSISYGNDLLLKAISFKFTCKFRKNKRLDK